MPRPISPQRDTLTIAGRADASPFLINGEPLAELIDRVLARSPEAYRAWNKAGGFLPMGLLHWDNYVTDDEERGREGFDVPLFKCNCGEWGCASVCVRILVDADAVTWHSFTISGLKGPAPGLGPFVFDGRQYERAFEFERPKLGLQQPAWHLGTMDEAVLHRTLMTELRRIVEAIATGRLPLPDGRRVQRAMPTMTDLEAYELAPRDVFDFDTGEVGSLAFTWWDEEGPEDWTVSATIFYSPEGARLQLRSIQPV